MASRIRTLPQPIGLTSRRLRCPPIPSRGPSHLRSVNLRNWTSTKSSSVPPTRNSEPCGSWVAEYYRSSRSERIRARKQQLEQMHVRSPRCDRLSWPITEPTYELSITPSPNILKNRGCRRRRFTDAASRTSRHRRNDETQLHNEY